MRKVEGNLVGPVVLLGIGKAGGGRLRVELLTCTIVRVVGSLSSVGGHKVLGLRPLAEGIMVNVIEIADLQGIAKGLRTRGIVNALQVKRTGASQCSTYLASDLGTSVPPRHTHTRVCVTEQVPINTNFSLMCVCACLSERGRGGSLPAKLSLQLERDFLL